MSRSKQDSTDIKLELLHTLTQPTRLKVLEVLLKTDSLYIKKIAELIDESERNTSFHLARLAEKGFVEGEFKQISSTNARAGKYYKINATVKPKIRRVVDLNI